jgi:leucyl-tRNA synthetase
MVCHETYKDEKGKWLGQDEIELVDNKNYVKKGSKDKVIVGQ